MKFNTKNTIKTTNHEGAKAYKLTPELELYSTVVTSMLESKFYESSALTRIKKLVKQVDSDFVAKLAIYTRNKMYLRSVPLVLLTELAKKGDLTKDTVIQTIQRADEITELLACYSADRSNTKKLNKLSKPIANGIKEIFESDKFDEYQYAKYNRKTDITFKNAIFLTHPNPTKNDNINKIVNDTLKVPYTWETTLSEKGNTKEVWEGLIDSNKLGYMALLRNLRNILNADVSKEHIIKVCSKLSDKSYVLNSKQLPFRFLSASQSIEGLNSFNTNLVLNALETAIQHSTYNIKGFDEDTNVVIACDVSGSMMHPISQNSSVELYDIGLVLGMLFKSKCTNVLSGIFGNTFKIVNQPTDNILMNVKNYKTIEGQVGYSTNGYKVIDHLIDNNLKADKVLIFTDCQMWTSGGWHSTSSNMQSSWSKYSKLYPNAKLYLFDLAGYGTTPVMHGNVTLISGWSNEIFNVLDAIENGESIINYLKVR